MLGEYKALCAREYRLRMRMAKCTKCIRLVLDVMRQGLQLFVDAVPRKHDMLHFASGVQLSTPASQCAQLNLRTTKNDQSFTLIYQPYMSRNKLVAPGTSVGKFSKTAPQRDAFARPNYRCAVKKQTRTKPATFVGTRLIARRKFN